jgi:hypothetical protein
MLKRLTDINALPENDKGCLLRNVDTFLRNAKTSVFIIKKARLFLIWLSLYFSLLLTLSGGWSGTQPRLTGCLISTKQGGNL